MSYLSPFTLLGAEQLSATYAELQETLRPARKRWLAEFELGGNEFIRLNGEEFSKTEVLAALDSCSDAEQLEFHRLVAAAPNLRKFLETGNSHPFRLLLTIRDWPLSHADRAQEAFVERCMREVRQAWRAQDAARMEELKKIDFRETDAEARYYEFVDTLHEGFMQALREDLDRYEKGAELSENLQRLSNPEAIRLWKSLMNFVDEIAEVYLRLYELMRERKAPQEEIDALMQGADAAKELTLEGRWMLEDLLQHGGGDEPVEGAATLFEADEDEEAKPLRSPSSTWIVPCIAVLAIAGIIFGLWWTNKDESPRSSEAEKSFNDKYVTPIGLGKGVVYYRNGMPVPKDSVWYYKMQEIAAQKELNDSLKAIFDSITPLEIYLLKQQMNKDAQQGRLRDSVPRDPNTPITLPAKPNPAYR